MLSLPLDPQQIGQKGDRPTHLPKASRNAALHKSLHPEGDRPR
ncbi:hypothetical protein [Thermoleptolyngbya oregonensis]|nr:hypothetical protein [Thermoleptolyngbya oregonensis]